jgi:hypothetical protein
MGFWQKLSKIKEYEAKLKSLQGSYDDLIGVLAKAIDTRDLYTSGHSERVTQYALALGKQLGLSSSELEKLKVASLLHDVGKIGVADEVLRKPRELTKGEFAEMKEHPVVGESILARSSYLKEIAHYVRHHHECYDGSGYPDGLKGKEIPIISRIIAVADAYDALTQDRVYRKASTPETARMELLKYGFSKFDPEVLGAFWEIWRTKRTKEGKLGTSTFLAEISIRGHEEHIKETMKTHPEYSQGELIHDLLENFHELGFKSAHRVVLGIMHPQAMVDDIQPEESEKLKEGEYKLTLKERLNFNVGEIVTYNRQNYALLNILKRNDGRFVYHLKR